MQALRIVPKIFTFNTVKEFNDEFKIGKKDLLVTNEWLYNPYIKPLGIDTNVLFQEKYGSGEPTDDMINSMAKDMKQFDVDRIIAFGGGTILDICKVLALELPEDVTPIFLGEIPPKKVKQLVSIPTTCGTGSEVTNVAITALKALGTKKGIAVDETYADIAVLIPEPLRGLPYPVFVTSSVDALIHAIESYLSPKASPFTEMYSLAAMDMIMDIYKNIVSTGEEYRNKHLDEALLASCYAGIAFGNAGCAAVHALSYSIGSAFHVPHGEANYQFFTEVFKMYQKKAPDGKIKQATELFARYLECDPKGDVYGELEIFLNKLIAKKPLRDYGMTEAQIDEFTTSTVANQQRLLVNNYVFLEDDEIREIFRNLY